MCLTLRRISPHRLHSGNKLTLYQRHRPHLWPEVTERPPGTHNGTGGVQRMDSAGTKARNLPVHIASGTMSVRLQSATHCFHLRFRLQDVAPSAYALPGGRSVTYGLSVARRSGLTRPWCPPPSAQRLLRETYCSARYRRPVLIESQMRWPPRTSRPMTPSPKLRPPSNAGGSFAST
jgi:hypothetical protein